MSNLKALGTNTTYSDQYDCSLLEGFERESKRVGFTSPVDGVDIWTAYEVSFLKPNGIPEYLVLRISNEASSRNIFESKSLKLYLNSFNNTVLQNKEELLFLVSRDLTSVAGGVVGVVEVDRFGNNHIYFGSRKLEDYSGELVVKEYKYNPQLLRTKEAKPKREGLVELHSDLLRSNCEITNQPDWGRVFIKYEPKRKEVVYESLLEYIISIRTHQSFHEPTCEIIFEDLYKLLNPKKLLVMCQYTRRGGIDINPIRYTHKDLLDITLLDLPKLIQQ